MEERKGYHCPVEATLDLIGGKYKTLILWHLAGGPQRFSQLQRLISRATPKMLTQQLRELEEIFTACSRYEASFWDMAWEQRV